MNVRGAHSMVRPDGEHYALDRWQSEFLTSRSGTIWGGTAQVQRNIVGERVLGLAQGAEGSGGSERDLRRDGVAIVTGAGRGIGRGHALELARQGAKVVVNDLGASVEGTGADVGPAQAVVDEIHAAGGEAIANTDDVSDWDGAQRLVATAIDAFGTLDVVVNNAGILRDRMLFNMDEAEWDAVIRVHLKGTFAPTRWAADVLAFRAQSGASRRRTRDQHVVDVGALRQPGPEQLRRREVGHRDAVHHRGQGARPVRRDGERRRAGHAHAHDREPRRRHAGSRTGRVGSTRARQHRAARDMARERGVGRDHRAGVPRGWRSHRDRARLAARSESGSRCPVGSGRARCGGSGLGRGEQRDSRRRVEMASSDSRSRRAHPDVRPQHRRREPGVRRCRVHGRAPSRWHPRAPDVRPGEPRSSTTTTRCDRRSGSRGSVPGRNRRGSAGPRVVGAAVAVVVRHRTARRAALHVPPAAPRR